jgi:hypothetical protein
MLVASAPIFSEPERLSMEYTMYEEKDVLRVRAWGRDTPRMPAPRSSARSGASA